MDKKKTGFAVMDITRVKEIASKGGKLAHVKGTAHQWNHIEAAIAGKKGAAARITNLRKRQQEQKEKDLVNPQPIQDSTIPISNIE